MQKLFVETIETVCHYHYSPEQISVWTCSSDNLERWKDKLTKQYFIIAEADNKIGGYASLENNDYVDLLYIHKDYQRQGIAKKLYGEIEKEARQSGQAELTADVSITARPFFEKVGFRIVNRQTVVKQDIELMNYKMTR